MAFWAGLFPLLLPQVKDNPVKQFWFFFKPLKQYLQLSKIIKAKKNHMFYVLYSFQTEMKWHWSGSVQECKDCKDARGIAWRLFQDWNA